jgi:urease subunit gamma/beta
MRLTPTERDRLLLFTAAELARSRKGRGLKLNVPEATALIADTARSILTAIDVLPGVTDIVTEVKVEAVFEDGTRMIVVRDPFRLGNLGDVVSTFEAPGAIATSAESIAFTAHETLVVINTSDVPVSITSHFHFFEVNSRLSFDRRRAYGMRLAIAAGSALRFDPGQPTNAPLMPIGGDRVAIGFAGLVDGALDDNTVRQRAYQRATEFGYLGMELPHE